MPPPSCLISDFGGVLTTPLATAFAGYQDVSGIPLEQLGRALARCEEEDGAHPLHELECGRVSEAAFLERIGHALSQQLGRPVAMHGFSATWFEHLHPNEEMLEHLGQLKARGLRLALLTNNVREWEPLWRPMLPVDDLFELVVDSAFVGLRKPDPRIFELTLERLGLGAEECVFLDDIDLNVAAAREVGLAAIHFQETSQAIAALAAHLAPGTEAVRTLDLGLSGPDDAAALAAIIEAGLAAYDFAPPGWRPPAEVSDETRIAAELSLHDTWSLLARGGDGVVGFVTVVPAREESGREIDGTAHVRHVFVRPDAQRAGIGRALLAAAHAQIERRFERARLWTASGNARARAFYEAAGWRATREEADTAFGLPMVLLEREFQLGH